MSLKSFIKRQIKKVIPRRRPPVGSLHKGIAPHQRSEVIDHYEKYTEDYVAVYGSVFQAGRPHDVELLLAHELEISSIQDGHRVLDAGCGVCGPAIWFAQHKQITVDAVTISPAQFPICQQSIAKTGLTERIKVHLGDYHKLPEMFPENTFDCVYFLESLCYAESYTHVLAGAFKVLKPGGCVYVKDYVERDFSHDPVTDARAREFLRKVYAEYVFTMVQKKEMAQMLEKVGFKIELIQPFPFVAEKEDLSVQLNFEKRVGFHWRDGLDFWLPELLDFRARKPLI